MDSTDLSANTVQVLGVYTTELHTVSSALPAALLVGDDNLPSTESSGDDTSDVDIDIWQYYQQMAPPGDSNDFWDWHFFNRNKVLWIDYKYL